MLSVVDSDVPEMPGQKRSLPLDDVMSTAGAAVAQEPKRGVKRAYKACYNCRSKKARCIVPDNDRHDPPRCERCRRELAQCNFPETRRPPKPRGAESPRRSLSQSVIAGPSSSRLHGSPHSLEVTDSQAHSGIHEEASGGNWDLFASEAQIPSTSALSPDSGHVTFSVQESNSMAQSMNSSHIGQGLLDLLEKSSGGGASVPSTNPFWSSSTAGAQSAQASRFADTFSSHADLGNASAQKGSSFVSIPAEPQMPLAGPADGDEPMPIDITSLPLIEDGTMDEDQVIQLTETFFSSFHPIVVDMLAIVWPLC